MVEGRQRGRRIGRWSGMALGVAAALQLMAAPTSAAPGATRSAVAFWDLDDAQQTMVSLQASTASGDELGSLFLFVTQSYCDTDTDEMVFRNFVSQQPLGPESFRVHPQLKSARLTTSTTVTGSEQRVSSCANPSGIPTFTSLGASTVNVDATWTATGPAYEVQPGFTARGGVATGSITGTTLSPGSLGEAQAAQLRSQTMQ